MCFETPGTQLWHPVEIRAPSFHFHHLGYPGQHPYLPSDSSLSKVPAVSVKYLTAIATQSSSSFPQANRTSFSGHLLGERSTETASVKTASAAEHNHARIQFDESCDHQRLRHVYSSARRRVSIGGNGCHLQHVEWIGASEGSRFDIDLHYCGSYSYCFDGSGDCGFYLASMCPEGYTGCLADDGGYEVVMPEPIIPGNGYRVRISRVGDGESRCSGDFYLMPSEDTMGSPPSISIVSPTSDSVALTGGEYTVEFEYDNGFGGTVGRFKIDLYESEGTGDCGTWQGSICDKPDRGCKDTTGDYNVVIPESTEGGMYKIRVGLFGDDSVYACSETFEVLDL